MDGNVQQSLSTLGIGGSGVGDVQVEEGGMSHVHHQVEGQAVSQQAASVVLNAYHAAFGGGASSLAGTLGVAASGYIGVDAPAGASVQGDGGAAFAAAAFEDANSNIAAAPQAGNSAGAGGGRLMRSNSVASRPSGGVQQLDGSNGYPPSQHDFNSHMHAAMSLMFQATSRAMSGPSHKQHQSQLHQVQHQQHGGGYSAGPSRMDNSIADLQTSHAAAAVDAAEAGPQASTSLVKGVRGNSHYHRDAAASPDDRRGTDTNSPASMAGSGGHRGSHLMHNDDAGQHHGSTLAVSLGDDLGLRSGEDDEVAGGQHRHGPYEMDSGGPQAQNISSGGADSFRNPGGLRQDVQQPQQRRGRGAVAGDVSYSRSHSHMQSNGRRDGVGETPAGLFHGGGTAGGRRGEEEPRMADARDSQLRSMSDLPDQVRAGMLILLGWVLRGRWGVMLGESIPRRYVCGLREHDYHHGRGGLSACAWPACSGRRSRRR